MDKTKSAFYLLLRARDHVIQNRSIPLEERLQTVDIIDGLSIIVARLEDKRLCLLSTSNLS